MARTTYTFYYMHDPENESMGYVGMTTEPIQKRTRRHIQEAMSREHSPESDKNVWLREIIDRGLKPQVKELEITGYRDPAHAGQREAYWVAKMKEEGKSLTNMTTGGLGTPGLSIEVTEEHKLKLGEAATKFDKDESLEKAIKMRKEGATYKKIYDSLGMSRSNFYKKYKDKVAEALK